MLMRNVLFLCIGVLLVAGVFALRAEPPQVKKESEKHFPLLRQRYESRKVIAGEEVAPLMHRKLDHAKEILEGLALEDHEKISNNARAMKLLSLEAGWKVIQTDEYMQQSQDFRRTCELIENAAKAEDANRAALCYVALTVRCVECHSYLRANKITLTNNKF